jgi:hypothetical protein
MSKENNKLIAEFMGFTQEKNIGWYDNDMLMSQNVYDSQDGNCFDELLFDQSWDWLMPVVETCYHNGADGNEIGDITHALLDCDIDQTYKAVVKFINEYNN